MGQKQKCEDPVVFLCTASLCPLNAQPGFCLPVITGPLQPHFIPAPMKSPLPTGLSLWLLWGH